MLAIIGGSSFLKSSIFSNFEQIVRDTPYGKVKLYTNNEDLVFVQRHQADTEYEYSPPHSINFHAIIRALKDMKCSSVIGFSSVGSLKPERIPIGSVLIASDYFNLFNTVTYFDHDTKGQIVPGYSEKLRKQLIALLHSRNIDFQTDCVYVQARGPRFETPAEIRFISTVGDVVGMTGAYEATLCNELKLPYTSIVSVDNLANGLEPSGEKLSVEKFHTGLAQNRVGIEKVLEIVCHEMVHSVANGKENGNPNRQANGHQNGNGTYNNLGVKRNFNDVA